MKKTTGKVLSLVLSLALVLTSFPAMFASASTHHTVTGTLSDTDNDKIYLVNGGEEDSTHHELTVTDLQNYIKGTKDDLTLETEDHQEKESAEIAAISHKSGDRLVKWYDGGTDDHDSIDDDTTKVDLQLRSPTVEGHEVLSILYNATYTDDDDNDVTIKGSKTFDVYVYDKNETVIGEADADTDDDVVAHKKSVELDSDFAEKTVSHEIDVNTDGENQDDTNDETDSKDLTVWEATVGADAPYVTWVPLKTVKDGTDDADAMYTLKSSNNNIELSDGSIDNNGRGVDATITAPGIAVNKTTGAFTINKVLSEATAPAAYYYTTDDQYTTAEQIIANGTKVAAAGIATIDLGTSEGLSGKTLKVVGADSETATTAKAVTKVVSAELGSSGYAFAGDATYGKGIGVPGLAVTQSSDNTSLAITVPADDNVYFYKIGAGNWTVDDDVTDPVSVGNVDNASTVTIQAYVAVADTTDVPEDLVAENESDKASYTKAAASDEGNGNYVTAKVVKPSSGSITFTAEATDTAKDLEDDDALSTTKDIKVKSKIDKKIIVDDTSFTNLIKVSGSTYISKDKSLDRDSLTDTNAVKVNSLEVNFNDDMEQSTINVSDKASVSKISGKLKTLNISDDSKVGSIALDDTTPSVTVSDAKVGDIDFDGTSSLEVNSTKASVGNVTDADTITVKSGKTGDLTADTKIDISADDDESATTVGDVKSKEVDIDSEDSKVTTGMITSKDADGEFNLQGNNLSVKGFDFDNYNTSLKFDDFQGKIEAPKNASQEGANITTTNGDDRVEITNDCDVDSISIEDDSQITFDGKLDITSVDGDGTLAIAAGKMYIDSDVSGCILKLTDATIAKGTTAFTSLSDTVDEDDFDCYGFTLAKTEGSKTDTFKVDSVVFKGLSVNKTSAEVAKDHSETFTAYPYPGGTTMPAGYTVKWELDGDDSIFALTTNENGTATVKVTGYDADFASNDKATLTATLVDPDGEECDTDEYAVGECDITALQVPKVTCTSDTNANFSLAQGASYQFKITSSDGAEPTFGVGSGSLAVSKVGKSGNDYFYKVTAVGKVGDQVGVYLNKTRLLVVTISAPSIQLDTGATLKVAQGKTYQFKATSTTAVNPTSGNSAVFQVVKVTKTGNNTYFTVKAVGSKGQSTGIYVNGVRRTVATVA